MLMEIPSSNTSPQSLVCRQNHREYPYPVLSSNSNETRKTPAAALCNAPHVLYLQPASLKDYPLEQQIPRADSPSE